MLINYVNNLNEKIKSDSSTRINAFDPRINNSIIILHTLMENYSKIEQKSDLLVPSHIKFKKRGEHSNTTFIFEDIINQESITKAIENMKTEDIEIVYDDNGFTQIEIEK